MIKLITHSDLDGIGCYIVAKYFIEEEIDVSYCSYKNVNEVTLETIEDIDDYNKVLITDISVNPEVAHKLNCYKDKVQLLDHHPTAEFLNEYSWVKVDCGTNTYKTSGTKMLFDYLVEDYANSSVVEFTELVRRYDTWYWKEINDIKAKQLNDLMYIVGKEEFVEDMVYKTKMNMKLLTDLDFKILELRQNEIDRYIEKKNKNIVVKDILGYKAGVVFADNFISELGNKLSEIHPELDFIAIINQETISYRTAKDDVNLSEVAKCFGGGGHSKASGSPILQCKLDMFLDMLFRD